MGQETLKIGQAAKRAGVGVDTLRYYERRGLLSPPERRPSGYRIYPATVVRRVRFIKRAQELGFTLAEIGELLDLRSDSQGRCGEVRAQVLEKIADIESRISTLENIKTTLQSLSTDCPGQGATSDCPILNALDEEISAGVPTR